MLLQAGQRDGALPGRGPPEAVDLPEVVVEVGQEMDEELLKIGKDRIRLLPRNPDYDPIEVAPDQDFAIEGLYCGLVRPNR